MKVEGAHLVGTVGLRDPDGPILRGLSSANVTCDTGETGCGPHRRLGCWGGMLD